MQDRTERRQWPRYAVTLSARVSDSERVYRAQILDVSTGGLLLSRPEDFLVETGARLVIEATMIGRIEARVVALSENGVHLVVEESAEDYESSIRKLSRISRSW